MNLSPRGWLRRSPPDPKWLLGVRSVYVGLVSLVLIAFATLVIAVIEIESGPRHLVFGYLVPTAFIAIRYGRIAALLSSLCCVLAAAYFLYAPRFSIYIADVRHAAELLLFALLAFIASQVIAGIAEDDRARKPPPARPLQEPT